MASGRSFAFRLVITSVVLATCAVFSTEGFAHDHTYDYANRWSGACTASADGYNCSILNSLNASDLSTAGLTEWRPGDDLLFDGPELRILFPDFPVLFGGNYYSAASINANGFISFTENVNTEPGSGTQYPALPNGTTPPNGGVALHGTDLFVGQSLLWYKWGEVLPWPWPPEYTDEHGSFYYGTRGTAPNREFVYMMDEGCHYWNAYHCQHNDGQPGFHTISSAVIFEENGGQVRIAIDRAATDCVDSISSWGNEYETIGYELPGASGTQGETLWRHRSNMYEHWEREDCVPWIGWPCWDVYSTHYERDYIDDRTIILDPPSPDPCGQLPYPEDGSFRCEASAYNFESPGSTIAIPDQDDTPYEIDLNGWGAGHECNSAITWAAFIGGMASDSIWMSPNGFISLESSSAYTPQIIPPPNATAPNSMIAGWWEDLNPLSGGNMWYQCRGTAPNRVLLMTWNAVQHFGGGDPITMQMKYIESSSNFEIHYDQTEPDGDATYEVAGWQDEVGAGVNFTATTQYTYDDKAVTLFQKDTPCGVVSSITVGPGQVQHVYCDIYTTEVDIAATGTLWIHGPYIVWAAFSLNDERRIDGTVIVDDGAIFYTDDLDRWEWCDEGDPGGSNDVVRLSSTGVIDVYGSLFIDSCPDESQAQKMWYWDGTINVFNTGLVRTVGSDGRIGLWNGMLRTQNDAHLTLNLGATVELGRLWLRDGADLTFNNTSAGHEIWRHAFVDNGSNLNLMGDTTTTFSDGYLDCSGDVLVSGTASAIFEDEDADGILAGALVDGTYRQIILDDGCFFDANPGSTVTADYGLAVLNGTYEMDGGNSTFGALGTAGAGIITVEGNSSLNLDGGTFTAATANADVTVVQGIIRYRGGTHNLNGNVTFLDTGGPDFVAPAGTGTLNIGENLDLYGEADHTGSATIAVVGDVIIREGADWDGTAGTLNVGSDLLVESNADFRLQNTAALNVVAQSRIDCTGSALVGRIDLDGTSTKDLGSLYVGSGSSATCRSQFRMRANAENTWMSGVMVRNRGEWLMEGGDATINGSIGGNAINVIDYGRLDLQGGDLDNAFTANAVFAASGLNPSGLNFEMTGGRFLVTGGASSLYFSNNTQGSMSAEGILVQTPNGHLWLTDSATLDVNDRSNITVAGGGLHVLDSSTLDLDDNTAFAGTYEFDIAGDIEVEGTMVLRRKANLRTLGHLYLYDLLGGSDGGDIDLWTDASIDVGLSYYANFDADVDLNNDSTLTVAGSLTNSGTAFLDVHNTADVDVTGSATNSATVNVLDSATFDAGDTVNSSSFLYDSDTSSTLASLSNSGSFTKNQTSQLTATNGFTNTAGTSDINDGILRLPSGPFNVSGGTVNLIARLDALDNTASLISGGVVNFGPGTWNNSDNLDINGGQVVMTAGTINEDAGHDIRVWGDNAYDWSGGQVTAGGLLINSGAQVFDGTAEGDFTRPLFVEDGASLALSSVSSDPEFDFQAGGTVDGNVTQTTTTRVDMTSLVVNSGAIPADGRWRQQNSSDLGITGNATFTGGDFIGEGFTTTDIGGVLTTNAGGNGPDILCQGNMSVDTIDQNAGTLVVDGTGVAVGQLIVNGSATPSHDVGDADFSVIAGANYMNSTSYNHNGGNFTASASTALLSAGAGNDATFVSVAGVMQYANVGVADDLLIRNGSEFDIVDGVGTPMVLTVGDTVEVSGTTGLRTDLDVDIYNISTWDVTGGLWVGGAADAVFTSTGGGMSFDFGTAEITTVGHYCNGTNLCSVAVDNKGTADSATLRLGDTVTFGLAEAIYASSGSIDLDETAVATVSGVGALDIAFFDDEYGAPTLTLDGELYA